VSQEHNALVIQAGSQSVSTDQPDVVTDWRMEHPAFPGRTDGAVKNDPNGIWPCRLGYFVTECEFRWLGIPRHVDGGAYDAFGYNSGYGALSGAFEIYTDSDRNSQLFWHHYDRNISGNLPVIEGDQPYTLGDWVKFKAVRTNHVHPGPNTPGLASGEIWIDDVQVGFYVNREVSEFYPSYNNWMYGDSNGFQTLPSYYIERTINAPAFNPCPPGQSDVYMIRNWRIEMYPGGEEPEPTP
jgi:hypothetical protein